jgi:hypothetical protein
VRQRAHFGLHTIYLDRVEQSVLVYLSIQATIIEFFSMYFSIIEVSKQDIYQSIRPLLLFYVFFLLKTSSPCVPIEAFFLQKKNA